MDEVLEANHWRWYKFMDGWQLSTQRDGQARAADIDATARALRGLGHEVTVEDVRTSNFRYAVRLAERSVVKFEALVADWDRLPPLAGKRPFVWLRRRVEAELEAWRALRDQLVENGYPYSQDTIGSGDYVRISGHWRKVVRVNRKSVSVRTETRVDKAPYHRITDHWPADLLGGDHDSPAP
ncbi:hypothetical protein [Kribbella koreensis]|uniref:hypothetical protein n=1 Tax=Kribbella koreensis TaxID=57909 RepID=UPI0031D32477